MFSAACTVYTACLRLARLPFTLCHSYLWLISLCAVPRSNRESSPHRLHCCILFVAQAFEYNGWWALVAGQQIMTLLRSVSKDACALQARHTITFSPTSVGQLLSLSEVQPRGAHLKPLLSSNRANRGKCQRNIEPITVVRSVSRPRFCPKRHEATSVTRQTPLSTMWAGATAGFERN